jgi:RNA polymerase sigma-70 factor (ECF subfamily)
MYRLTANAHDAEELTQEAFLRAMQKLDQYQAGTNMRGWLLRIATNMFLDGKRRARPKTGDMSADVAAPPERAGANLERMELSRQLQGALLQLPETQRTVFLLRSTEEMAFREISEMIGTTEATARWHMLQARQQLVKLLEGKI